MKEPQVVTPNPVLAQNPVLSALMGGYEKILTGLYRLYEHMDPEEVAKILTDQFTALNRKQKTGCLRELVDNLELARVKAVQYIEDNVMVEIVIYNDDTFEPTYFLDEERPSEALVNMHGGSYSIKKVTQKSYRELSTTVSSSSSVVEFLSPVLS